MLLGSRLLDINRSMAASSPWWKDLIFGKVGGAAEYEGFRFSAP
jgi:hypothetical protein